MIINSVLLIECFKFALIKFCFAKVLLSSVRIATAFVPHSPQIGIRARLEKIMAAKYDVEKFTGSNDFGLWRMKMKALLVHQGLYEALLGERDKKEVLDKAHSAIILNLGDKVLRKVARETTAAGVWLKLEGLYMTKSLVNRLYLK